MGNSTSCAPSMISKGGVKVLFSDGRLEVYTRPIKAAELMLECPGQFVCDSKDLKVDHRIQGLSADEELELRQLYFVLPMDMLYSVLTNEEKSSLTYKASKALKHRSSNNFARIFPVFSEFCIFPSEANKTLLLMDNSSNAAASEPEPVERYYSKQRSWRPALDTIVEAPCRL